MNRMLLVTMGLILSGIGCFNLPPVFGDDAVINAPAAASSPSTDEKAAVLDIRAALAGMMRGGNTSPAAWDAIDAKLDNFSKQFGTSDPTTMDLVMLRRMELAVAHKLDPTRYAALQAKLASDPEPKVATMAVKFAQLVELMSKPLDLKYTAADGTDVNLSKMRGKVVLIDFWATWCGPCRREIPNVVAAYQKYHDQGFEVVGVSLDQNKTAMVNYTSQNGMPWPQYFDGKGWQNDLATTYGITSIPAMWLVGKDGMLITTNARADLDGQVGKALAAP